MPRSGSTLLFNILREILSLKYGQNLSFGWIHDLIKLPSGRAYLIKTHTLGPIIRIRSGAFFYTFRDIRTALVSSARRFESKPSIDLVDKHIKEYKIAQRYATLLIRYEDLIDFPEDTILAISKELSIQTNASEIWAHVNELESPKDSTKYSKTTLLHPNHKTGTGNDDWRLFLESDLICQISEKYGWWLRECGYPEE
ncbi:MAG: hypothetical protein ACFFCW_27140 [Candidatus Hodarchaeota archaeon]